MADKTIEALSVTSGQVIWIWASTHSLDFIEALAIRIRMRGAFWGVRLIMEPLLRRIGMNDRMGGQNNYNLHLDLVMLHPSLWLDGVPLHWQVD